MKKYQFVSDSAPTFSVKIHIAGSIDQIEMICQKYCFEVGLCVTVQPQKFIYTGGAEAGAVIGLVNYPRFPTTYRELVEVAKKLASELMHGTYQRTCLVQAEDDTIWMKLEEVDNESEES